MLKLKKILPVVFAAALIFSGCGSSEPAGGGSAESEGLSTEVEVIDEAAEESSADQELSAESEAAEGEEAQKDSSDEKESSASSDTASETKSTAASSDSKSDTAKASTTTNDKAASQTKTSETKSASSGTAASSKPAASSNTASAAPAETKAAEPSYKYKDGTYSGSAQGFNGPVGVSVTISKDKITSVSVTSSTDDEPYITNAKALCSKIASSNSADVSGVSGATYSSNGIKGAVKAALAKAEN